MDNITQEAYETIRKLILESEWGRSVTNTSLYSFLFSEIYEFMEGCNKRDKDNMLEEASDVLMILLYIVIKNIDNQQDNQIEELLHRVNKKLRTRYSLFFEGIQDSEKEELHWVQEKHAEKETLHFLFCPNPDCHNHAKANKGNMILKGNQAICRTCGYTAPCSKENTIFYTSKYRRRLMDTLDDDYVGYLGGSNLFADAYFNIHHADYIRVVCYWVADSSGSLALSDYFASKHSADPSTFNEFLMHPLRNFMRSVTNQQVQPLRSAIEINDLIVKCINTNYTAIRGRFCEHKSEEYFNIWKNYVQYLLKSMNLPIVYEPISFNPSVFLRGAVAAQPKESHLPLNSYTLHIHMAQNKEIDVYLGLFSVDGHESGGVLYADLSGCQSNTQVGQILLSAVLKFNLQHVQKMRYVLLNIRKNLDQLKLSEFLKDLLPISKQIEYR